MLISSSKNFVFVHIFKTAGTSVSNLFLPYARFIEKVTYKYFITKKLVAIYARVFHLENEGQEFITGYHKHATAEEVLEAAMTVLLAMMAAMIAVLPTTIDGRHNADDVMGRPGGGVTAVVVDVVALPAPVLTRGYSAPNPTVGIGAH